jgi:hypothetical protein
LRDRHLAELVVIVVVMKIRQVGVAVFSALVDVAVRVGPTIVAFTSVNVRVAMKVVVLVLVDVSLVDHGVLVAVLVTAIEGEQDAAGRWAIAITWRVEMVSSKTVHATSAPQKGAEAKRI